MSFTDCVEEAVRNGRINRQQAEELYQRRGDAERRFTMDMQDSPESIARMADELSIETMRQRVRLQRYQAARQAIRNHKNWEHIRGHSPGVTKGVQTVLTRDVDSVATWANVDTETKNIVGQAHARLSDGLSELRTRWLGFERDNEMLEMVVRELHGESTGHARAAHFAQEWAKVAEDLRLRFNRAGGAIPKRADWGSPQNHDSIKVSKVTETEWIDFVMDLLDIERMTDMETGLAYTTDSLVPVLQGVYKTISTNGASDMIPGAQGGRKLANRRQDHRFLVFKDAESWLTYQKKFGEENMFATLMGHIDSMARDIALMEILGPNPTQGFRYLQDIAEQLENKPTQRMKNQAAFNLVAGTGDKNKSVLMADIFGSIRSWNVSTKLGGASISAISDQGFAALTLNWNGLGYIKFFNEFLRQLNPANEADRIMATRAGITALSMVDAYSNVARFSEVGSSGGTNVFGKISHGANMAAEAVLRASGLSAMTDAARRAFAVTYSSNMAMQFGKRLDEIDPKFRQSLTSRGMTETEWDLLRQTPTTDYKGARFFTVDQLMAREDIPLGMRERLASKIQSVINQEMTFAVPEPDVAARIWTTGGKQRGTPTGELIRSGGQFKSFSVAVLSTHANRVRTARKLRGPMTQAAYIAEGIIITTILGYVAMQLKMIAYGKNPRKIDSDDPSSAAKVLGASFLQGGGAGIFGDVLFSDINRFGGGITSTVLGPSLQLVDDTARLTLGNIQQAARGDETNFVAESINYAKRYTPGNNLWFSRLLIERELFDQAMLWADPAGARRKFRRAERLTQDLGSDYWWRPGETTPDSSPSLELIE